MEIDKIIRTENIIFDFEAKSRDEVIQKIVDKLNTNNNLLNKDKVFQGYLKREEEGTTGFGKGIAIPHCKSCYIKNPEVIIISLINDVDWAALDNENVKYIIGLAIPEAQSGNMYLSLLGALASKLMEDDFVDNLLNIKDKNILVNYLKRTIQEELK